FQVSLTVSSGTAAPTARRGIITVAPPPRTVHCGDSISASVTLTTDLTCPGNGLIITAPDVTLDLGGHTIAGNGSNRGVIIGVGLTSALTGDTVRNGTISRFSTGLELGNLQNVTASKLTLLNDGESSSAAIDTGGVLTAQTVRILNCRISQNSGISI